MDLIRKPIQRATSKPALSAYLNTILFLITSTILLALAICAYVLFYYNYIPQIGTEKTIHLQYGDGAHPYGITTLDSSLISQQAYDIKVTLTVPRSPPNLSQGNFMLSLALLSPTYQKPLPSPTTVLTSHLLTNPLLTISQSDILFSSRRPTILTYNSPFISLSARLISLPLHLLGFLHESETLSVPMAEKHSFPRGWKNIPNTAFLEIQAGQGVQIYDVKIHFTARFGGLRWLMYNYRIASFIVFTGGFWGFEVFFAGMGWFVLGLFLGGGEKEGVKEEGEGEETEGTVTGTIKTEGDGEGDEFDEPDLSDTPRTFPTYGRQPPLRFIPKIKKEEEGEEVVSEELNVQPLGVEADDEDDEEGGSSMRGGRDSGIGTSFSEGGDRSGVQRRRSKGKGRG